MVVTAILPQVLSMKSKVVDAAEVQQMSTLITSQVMGITLDAACIGTDQCYVLPQTLTKVSPHKTACEWGLSFTATLSTPHH